MTEIKVDNIVDVDGTGKPNFPVAPTHSTGSALSTLNTYQYDTTTRVVTVVDDNGTNKFAIDGVTAPTITLLRGVTYTFDVSDSSVSTHPLAFKNAGTSYTTGVTSSGTAGTAGATVTFAVASDAPLTGLTYYCTTHGDGMGSSVTTSDPKNGAMLWDGAVKFYVDSEFKAIGTSDSGGGGGSTYSNSGDRGVFFGGVNSIDVVNVMEYVDITTPGNAQDFGDLTETTRRVAGCSNGTRGLRMGNVASPGTTIDYVTISTTGNAQDFGDLTLGRYYCGSFSDGTYGFTVGGTAGSTTWDDTIDYVTISTTGNATDFGNTTVGCVYVSGLADGTRGVYQLGSTQSGGTATNNIEYITTATPGNGTDFGDLTNPTSTKATGADATRGIFAQGYEGQVYTDVIEYITIQTTGNATDFGDATIGANRPTGTANSTRMLMASGNGPSPNFTKYDTIAYITIQTTGNATDFGDLSEGKVDMGAFSGAAA